ncbi:carbohydrate porin [Rhodopseudomonas sp. RCAM05734]|uniref:carbohydrate porin n=1 Tax=Rhodopseudomonas sp. RCAM05734 TaxID=3457549 RepID=UPI004043CBE7
MLSHGLHPLKGRPSGQLLKANLSTLEGPLHDPPLFIAELTYLYGQEHANGMRENPNQEGSRRAALRGQSSATDLPGAIKIGAMIHTGLFADQRFDTQSSLLAVSGGLPLQHRGNYAVYGVVDQMLWRSASGSDQSLSVFLRGTWAPGAQNVIDLYLDGGVTFKGPIASRPDDTMGIAFAYGRISPQSAAFDRDLAGIAGTQMPVRNFEAALEWTYQWEVADNWFFQPNIQYIMHPGGNVPSPLNPASTSPVPDALVFGMRTTIKF